jgi:hypothetical protein
MIKHYRQYITIFIVLLLMFLLSPQTTTHAVCSDYLNLSNPSPSSPQPAGTHFSISATGCSNQGIEAIIFYINSDPNGGSNGNWHQFGYYSCWISGSSCTRSAQTSWYPPPFPMQGRHLVAVNALLVSTATSGDVFYNGRWYLAWNYNSSRQKVFNWAGSASLISSTPNAVAPEVSPVTFNATATWNEGLDQIHYYVNTDPNGGSNGNWHLFGITYCNNTTSACNGSATLSAGSVPFFLSGRHLVVINALLSTTATGGDCFCSGRWYLVWNVSPSRQRVFNWAGSTVVTNVTPVSPRPDGDNITISANARWNENGSVGVDKVYYYANYDPNGIASSNWQQIAIINCSNSLNCNSSTALNYYGLSNPPYVLHGRHLIVINVLLSLGASGGDVFDGSRWWLVWSSEIPQQPAQPRSQVFQWASVPAAAINGPADVIKGWFRDYNVNVTNSDGNLSFARVYASNDATPNVWFQIGNDIPCSGSTCSGTVSWNTGQLVEAYGDFDVVVNAYTVNGIWCSGNIRTVDGVNFYDLWGGYLGNQTTLLGRPCGTGSNTFVRVWTPDISPVSEITNVCRWPHTPGHNTSVTYKWGSNLQNPGSLWRNAFTFGITAWNSAYYPQTGPIRLYYSEVQQNEMVTVNTSWSPGYYPGWAAPNVIPPNCSGLHYDVFGNSAYTVYSAFNYVGTHELGHALGIDHIPDLPRVIAVMRQSGPFDQSLFNIPQPADLRLVNQTYP